MTSFQLLLHRRNEPQAFLYPPPAGVERDGPAARAYRGAHGDGGEHPGQEPHHGLRLNAHLDTDCGLTVFQHACKLGAEGIVSKRLGSRYRSGRSADWLKFKNPDSTGGAA